ncbi:MAG TPA: hypothetical protein VLG41_01080, partial [Hydrogenophaga sp.]|nr:hypothetical protein [Hydrogenophaga sp.]
VNNYLSHQERVTYNKADKACKTSGQQCATAAALKYKDELSDRLLANAVIACEGAACNEVSNFIQQQMASLGCTAPSACPDYGTLNDYWTAAQAKAQGLEGVYPETWLLDAKAVLDLGKLGIRLVTSGGTAGLDALQALTKIDSQTIANGFYRDGLPYDIRRMGYESAATNLRESALKMLASGKSEEEVARWAHAQRNQLKVDFRDISPQDFVEKAEARNMLNYGNPLGPSVEQLRGQGKSWLQIIESSARPGGADFGFGGMR